MSAEFKAWKFGNDIRVEVLAEAIAIVDKCKDLSMVRSSLVQLHDAYALSSWPKHLRKDESTDHQL